MKHKYTVEVTWTLNDYGTLKRKKYQVDKLSELDTILASNDGLFKCLDEILIYPNLKEDERSTLLSDI